jgi:hypothetical protein
MATDERIGQMRNRATVYRPTETRDGYGDVAPGYVAGATFWLAIERDSGNIVDRGPGDEPAVKAKGLAQYGADVAIRDMLSVAAGPEAGTKWRVLSAFHPKARHTELELEQYTGSLT